MLVPASSKENKTLITSASSTIKAIPSGIVTSFMTIVLPANHTYLVTGSHQWQSAESDVYTADSCGPYNVRSSNGMYSGGGVSISGIIAAGNNARTVEWTIYQNSGSEKTAKDGILLAWQLD